MCLGDNKSVVEIASARMLSPPAVPPHHRVSSLRDVLPVPRLLYSADHAGVELHKRAVTTQSHFQISVLVFWLELHFRDISLTLIQRAHSQLSCVTSRHPFRTKAGKREVTECESTNKTCFMSVVSEIISSYQNHPQKTG